MKNLDRLSLSDREELLSSSRKVTWQTEDSAAKFSWIACVSKAQRSVKAGCKTVIGARLKQFGHVLDGLRRQRHRRPSLLLNRGHPAHKLRQRFGLSS